MNKIIEFFKAKMTKEKTVDGILANFTQAITDLEQVEADKNRAVTMRVTQIKSLKAANLADQAEISRASKVAKALSKLVN